MTMHVQRLIYTESGGFAGLRRGCTVDAHSLPPEPSQQLSGLLAKPQALKAAAQGQAAPLPDQMHYTLELVTEPADTATAKPGKPAAKPAGEGPAPSTPLKAPRKGRSKDRTTNLHPSPASAANTLGESVAMQSWVLRYIATDVPKELHALMDYLHERAQPL